MTKSVGPPGPLCPSLAYPITRPPITYVANTEEIKRLKFAHANKVLLCPEAKGKQEGRLTTPPRVHRGQRSRQLHGPTVQTQAGKTLPTLTADLPPGLL